MASRMLYTVVCRELASHGYIVFAPDHHDGSNHYTEQEDGTPIKYDLSINKVKGEEYYEKMHEKVLIREHEIKEIIDEISDPSYPFSGVGLTGGVYFDMSKLIVAGHSMGGVTALRIGQSDPRVNCILTLDPWLLPIHKEVLAGKFNYSKENQSLMIINSEIFQSAMESFDGPGCCAKILDQFEKVSPKVEEISMN